MGSLEDLNRAISSYEEALLLTLDDSADQAALLNNLSSALQSRFEQIGALGVLDRAITLNQRAVVSFQLGSLEDINLATRTNEEAIASLQHNDIHRAICLNSISASLQRRFEQMKSIEDIDGAIQVTKEAIVITPEHHPDRAICLSSLGSSLQRRFEHLGIRDDLDQSIINNNQAVLSTPSAHNDRAIYLSNLGTALQKRFDLIGSMDDLDEVILKSEQAVTLCPDGHSNRPMYLNNLGIVLQRRFDRTGSMDDLDRAIDSNEQAIALTSKVHPNRIRYLNNFSNALQNRYERTQSIDDLNRAIDTSKESLLSTTENHGDYTSLLSNLAFALQRRFEQTTLIEDLDEAIKVNERALELASDFNRVSILHNLGTALRRRFEKAGLMGDIDRAITLMQETVVLTPRDHPICATFLNGLGTALWRRFDQTESIDDLDKAITTNEEAALIDSAPPVLRIGAADLAARLLIGRDWSRANKLLIIAIELLPRTSPGALKQADRRYQISQFLGITSRAVSVSIQFGEEPYRSLQLSELGNGVFATLQLEVRSDISSLEKSKPDLARIFHELRDQMNRSPTSLGQSPEPASHDDNEIRRGLSNHFERLLTDIREIKGFELFLLAPSESKLRALANCGPIVVFNVSEFRSDAIIVESDKISVFSLPLLTYQQLDLSANHFLSVVQAVDHTHYASAKSEVHEVLKWIWDVAVCPVLDHLDYVEPDTTNSFLARVWWVGSGLLNVLPIHAAGYHQLGSNKTVIDRVISSYTPTAKALAYARERNNNRAVSAASSGAMLVEMSETPNQSDLAFVKREINDVDNLLSKHMQTLVLEQPTRAQVLSALNSHQIAHFSCHGYSSAANPSANKLLLTDWEKSPLTVADLTLLNLPQARLAYLSACHSASSRDVRLLGESINLASAIQLAGYPSVIATLWQVMDENSSEVSRDVHEGLLRENKLDTELSARSLHHAVRRLREKSRVIPGFKRKVSDDPLVWAAFIHLGVQ